MPSPNTAAGSSLAVIHNGHTIMLLDLLRPIGCSVMGWLSSHENAWLLEQIARMVGLDADYGRVPEHRKHTDEPSMLLGYSVDYGETRQLSKSLFERDLTLTLSAGRSTGPNSCTYVNTDTRSVALFIVSDWSATTDGVA